MGEGELKNAKIGWLYPMVEEEMVLLTAITLIEYRDVDQDQTLPFAASREVLLKLKILNIKFNGMHNDDQINLTFGMYNLKNFQIQCNSLRALHL
jgi:hypothetical protein